VTNELTERFIAARRAVIALDFPHLNEIQRRAVMTTEGPLLLLAGAGSGKTTVLINRIANLLKYGRGADCAELPANAAEEDVLLLEAFAENPREDMRNKAVRLCAVEPAEPWRIIAITFTNKAAGEMKSRLERMLGSAALDIWAMTFHSACVRILRRDADQLGYDRSFAIYDTADSQSLMKRIIKELNLDDKTFPHKTVLGYISRAKDAMISAEEFCAGAEKGYDLRKRQIGALYLEYTRRMKVANALDFDDLILLTVRLLSERRDVLERYQERFRYVLIDEYQDTNNLQYMLASLLAGGRGNICVVGDDDQSIYKFRGATIENILGFESKYKNAQVIRLEQNYRSCGHILDAANDVIRNNHTRHGKKLWTENDAGEKLTLFEAADERDEARFVATAIISGVAEGKRWSDHAILYRMNAQSNRLEFEFKRNNIPYRVLGGTGFFERAEIKDMLAYLCVVNNPGDETHLLRVINNPPRGIGGVTIDKLAQLAAEDGLSLFEIIENARVYSELQSSAGRLHQFADFISAMRELAETLPLDAFYDALLDATGYIRALEAKQLDENLARIENVRELKTNIVNFLRENPGGALTDFLSEMALYTDLDSYDRDADCVVMMTMHSAKGLEFDTVFIVGAEEGIFPGVRAIGEQEEMEEERRLCYVAMTRAKRRLFLTCARQRTLFGKTTAGKLSRFAEEISDENIDKPEPVNRFSEYRFDQSFDDYKPAYAAPRKTARPAPPPPAAPSEKYSGGDRIVHRAFGKGVITSMKPTGGDALIEVEFETAGKKRLMLKSAAAYMARAAEEDIS
jgi:DNA helicase-2/ATP-dependent DNA helicase PcrA